MIRSEIKPKLADISSQVHISVSQQRSLQRGRSCNYCHSKYAVTKENGRKKCSDVKRETGMVFVNRSEQSVTNLALLSSTMDPSSTQTGQAVGSSSSGEKSRKKKRGRKHGSLKRKALEKLGVLCDSHPTVSGQTAESSSIGNVLEKKKRGRKPGSLKRKALEELAVLSDTPPTVSEQTAENSSIGNIPEKKKRGRKPGSLNRKTLEKLSVLGDTDHIVSGQTAENSSSGNIPEKKKRGRKPGSLNRKTLKKLAAISYIHSNVSGQEAGSSGTKHKLDKKRGRKPGKQIRKTLEKSALSDTKLTVSGKATGRSSFHRQQEKKRRGRRAGILNRKESTCPCVTVKELPNTVQATEHKEVGMYVCALASNLKDNQVLIEQQKKQNGIKTCSPATCSSPDLPNPAVRLQKCDRVLKNLAFAKKVSEPKSMVSVNESNLAQLVFPGDVAARQNSQVSALKNNGLETSVHQKRQIQRKRLIREKTDCEKRPRRVTLCRSGSNSSGSYSNKSGSSAERSKNLHCNIQHKGNDEVFCNGTLQQEVNNNFLMDEGLQQNTFEGHGLLSLWDCWRTPAYLLSDEEYSDSSLLVMGSPSMSPCSPLPQVKDENISCQRVKPFTGKTIWKCSCARTSIWTFSRKRPKGNKNTEIDADKQSLHWRTKNDNEPVSKKRKLDLLDLVVPNLDGFNCSSCSRLIGGDALNNSEVDESTSKPILHEPNKVVIKNDDDDMQHVADTSSKTLTGPKLSQITTIIKAPAFKLPSTYRVEKEPNLDSGSWLNEKETFDVSYCSPLILDYFGNVFPIETCSSPPSCLMSTDTVSVGKFDLRDQTVDTVHQSVNDTHRLENGASNGSTTYKIYNSRANTSKYVDASDSDFEPSLEKKHAINNATPEASNDTAPESLDGTVPDASKDAAPGPLDGAAREASNYPTLEAIDDTALEALSAIAPKALAGASPEASDFAAPETLDGAVPEALDGTPPEALDEAPPETFDVAPPETFDGASPETSDGAAPETSDGAAPEAFDGAAPEAFDGASPEAFDGASPEAFVGAAPEASDDAAPEASDGAAPEASDGAAPETYDGAAPETYDGASPEAFDGAASEASDGAACEAPDVSAPKPSDAAPDALNNAALILTDTAFSVATLSDPPNALSDATTNVLKAYEDDVLIIDVIPDDPDLFGCFKEENKSPKFCGHLEGSCTTNKKTKNISCRRNIPQEKVSFEYDSDSPMEIDIPEDTPAVKSSMLKQEENVPGNQPDWTYPSNPFPKVPESPFHLFEEENQDPPELPNQSTYELNNQTEISSWGGECSSLFLEPLHNVHITRLPQPNFSLQTESVLNENHPQWMHGHRKDVPLLDVVNTDSWDNCRHENKLTQKELQQIKLPYGYCKFFFNSTYGCYKAQCSYLHVPKEGDEKLCMDLLLKMINENRISYLQRAFLVFNEYYSKYLPSIHYDEGVFNALLDQLLRLSWWQEVLHLLETAMSANILPSVETFIKVFECIASSCVQRAVPSLMDIFSKCLDAGLTPTLPEINHIIATVSQLPNSRLPMNYLLSVKSKIGAHLPKKRLVHELEVAMMEIEHCKVNSDWVKLGTLYVNICTGRDNITDLKNFSRCIAEALMKESMDDRPDVPYCEFADTIFKHPQLNDVHRTFVGRIGISIMFFYYRKELWQKGRRVLFKLRELRINYNVLKGITGQETFASRCAVINVAVEIFLMCGRLNSAVQTLRECDWILHSAVWPCDKMDVLKRHSLLCTMVQQALSKSMYTMCFEILQNLPGFKESQAEFNVSQYSDIFNRVLNSSVSNRSLNISSLIVDFMVLRKIPIDYLNLRELITAFGHSTLWQKARDHYKYALSLGFYSLLDGLMNSTILYIPSFMSAIEMLLTIERFMVSNSRILQLPGGCTQNLQIILRKIFREEDSSKDAYHAASERLLEASRLSSPRLFTKYLTVNNSDEQVYTLDHNCCVKWLNENLNWAVKIWGFH